MIRGETIQLQQASGILTPRRVVIDWTHPITQGLIGCWVPGILPNASLVDGLILANGSAPQANFMTAEGPSIRNNQANAGLKSGTAPVAFRSNPMSIYWRGVAFGNPSTNTAVFGVGSHTTATSPFIGPATIAYSGNQLGLWWNSGGVDTTILISASPPTANTVFSCGGTVPGANQTCFSYLNGKNISSGAFGASAVTFTDGLITYGVYSALETRFSNTDMIMGCIWNRALSDDEHGYIHTNPYDFLMVVDLPFAALSFEQAAILALVGGGAPAVDYAVVGQRFMVFD